MVYNSYKQRNTLLSSEASVFSPNISCTVQFFQYNLNFIFLTYFLRNSSYYLGHLHYFRLKSHDRAYDRSSDIARQIVCFFVFSLKPNCFANLMSQLKVEKVMKITRNYFRKRKAYYNIIQALRRAIATKCGMFANFSCDFPISFVMFFISRQISSSKLSVVTDVNPRIGFCFYSSTLKEVQRLYQLKENIYIGIRNYNPIYDLYVVG